MAARPSGPHSKTTRQLACPAPKSFAPGNRSAQQQRNCATTRTARHSGREFIKRLPKKPLQQPSSESVGAGALFSRIFRFPGGCGLPGNRKIREKRAPAPTLSLLGCCSGFFGKRLMNSRPECRAVRVVAQFRCCCAERFPGAKLFGAGHASCRVVFECGPLGRAAILENSISIFTGYIHGFTVLPRHSREEAPTF